jgi:hypothetical protein
MNLRNVVWTAVTAVASVVGMIVAGILGSMEWIITFGFAGVVLASLSNRER